MSDMTEAEKAMFWFKRAHELALENEQLKRLLKQRGSDAAEAEDQVEAAGAEVKRLVDIIIHALRALEDDLPGEAWSALKAGTRLSNDSGDSQ